MKLIILILSLIVWSYIGCVAWLLPPLSVLKWGTIEYHTSLFFISLIFSAGIITIIVFISIELVKKFFPEYM